MIDIDKRVKIVELLEAGEKPARIARELKISRTSVYHVKREAKEGKLKRLKADEVKEPTGVVEAIVIKEVPNPRLLLATVNNRFVRVVKKPNLRFRPRTKVLVMEVKGDIYRLV